MYESRHAESTANSCDETNKGKRNYVFKASITNNMKIYFPGSTQETPLLIILFMAEMSTFKRDQFDSH